MQIEVEHYHGRLLWMLPAQNDSDNDNSVLVEKMIAECGRRELTHIIGSLDEDSIYLDIFKKHGFASIGWEQVWQYFPNDHDATFPDNVVWKKTQPSQLPKIQQIQNSILTSKEKLLFANGQIYPPQYCLFKDGELAGYAYAFERLDQVIIKPYITSDILNPEKAIYRLFESFFSNYSLLYIVQLSNFHFSNSVLSEKCKRVSKRRKRIVKQLAISNKDVIVEYNHAGNGRNTNIVTPLSK